MLLLCRSLRLSVHLSSPRAPARPPWPLGRYAKGKRKMRERGEGGGGKNFGDLQRHSSSYQRLHSGFKRRERNLALRRHSLRDHFEWTNSIVPLISVTLHIHDSGSGDLPSLMYSLQSLSNSLSRWLDLNFRYTAWPEDVLQQTFMETFCPRHYRSASETRPKSREMA